MQTNSTKPHKDRERGTTLQKKSEPTINFYLQKTVNLINKFPFFICLFDRAFKYLQPLMKYLLIFFIVLFVYLLRPAIGQSVAGNAKELYHTAQEYQKAGKLSVALDFADQAIRQKSDFVEAYLLRARIKDDMDFRSDANTDYSIALHLEPTLNDARFQRGINYFKLQRYQDATHDFHRLLKDSSQSTTTVYFKGKSDPQGFTANSVTTLQSDMRADIYNYLGLIHLKTNQTDSAFYYLDQAILRKTNEADYYVNRGLLHEHQADTNAAIADYQRALGYQSDHYAALNNLNKLSAKGQYEQLLTEAYDLAVREQGSFQAYFNRAVNLQFQGKHRLAILDFNQAHAIAGNDAETLLMRAYSKERALDLRGALKDYTQALRLDPMLGKAYSNRGNVYYKLKQYRQAIADYNRAIEFYPNEGKLFYNRGLALYLSGQRTDACIDLRIALEKGHTSAQAPIQSYCER